MDFIFSASILASFLAGLVALFAPCCITVVLPTYLASALKRRHRVVAMTLVFFLGLAAVLIPIALGAAWLAELLRRFHQELYLFGGLLMLLFAWLALAGLKMPLSMMKPSLTAVTPGRPWSVFMLGLFSGAATACCAPVLAGAVTLTILSGSFWKALVVAFAYVAGMIFPLLIAAYFYDRFHLADSRFLQGRSFTFRLLGKTRTLNTLQFISAALFLLMGVIFLIMGLLSDGYWAPAWQVTLGKKLNNWSGGLFTYLSVVPDFIWAVLILVAFIFITRFGFRSSYRSGLDKDSSPSAADHHHCHHDHD